MNKKMIFWKIIFKFCNNFLVIFKIFRMTIMMKLLELCSLFAKNQKAEIKTYLMNGLIKLN